MQITLQQADIEAALKLYIRQSGLTQDVEKISFTKKRQGGFSIAADVTLAGLSFPSAAPTVVESRTPVESDNTPEVNDEVTETVTLEEVAESEEEQKETSIFG